MRVRTLVLGLVVVLFIILMIPVLFLCVLVQSRWPIIAAGKFAVRLARAILGVHVEISGLSHIEKGRQYIFMSNHLSLIDGPLLFQAIPQPARVILKREVFRIPVIGLAMLFVGFIPVDRKGLRGGKRSLERAAALMARRRYSFLIFPEGTRSRDGALQAFKRGGFFLALQGGVPIVPMTIQGTFHMMPRRSFWIRKGRIRVVFHPAVPVEEYDQETMPGLIERVRASVQSGFAKGEM